MKGEQAQKGKKGKREERREQGKRKQRGEERTSCMCRVEFYACLIWKWIVRECASMSRVVKRPVGETDARKQEREGSKREENG